MTPHISKARFFFVFCFNFCNFFHLFPAGHRLFSLILFRHWRRLAFLNLVADSWGETSQNNNDNNTHTQREAHQMGKECRERRRKTTRLAFILANFSHLIARAAREGGWAELCDSDFSHRRSTNREFIFLIIARNIRRQLFFFLFDFSELSKPIPETGKRRGGTR